MKFSQAIGLLLVAGLSAAQECWSEAQGYPCCQKTKEVVYIDESGEWGIENN